MKCREIETDLEETAGTDNRHAGRRQEPGTVGVITYRALNGIIEVCGKATAGVSSSPGRAQWESARFAYRICHAQFQTSPVKASQVSSVEKIPLPMNCRFLGIFMGSVSA